MELVIQFYIHRFLTSDISGGIFVNETLVTILIKINKLEMEKSKKTQSYDVNKKSD